MLTLNFPSRPALPAAASEALVRGLGARPADVLKARDYLAVFASETEVRALKPDFAALRTLDALGIIATAPGDDCDFVSRFFAPAAGINEDPVTGSAHCTLIPYWAQRLGKPSFVGATSFRAGRRANLPGSRRPRLHRRAGDDLFARRNSDSRMKPGVAPV